MAERCQSDVAAALAGNGDAPSVAAQIAQLNAAIAERDLSIAWLKQAMAQAPRRRDSFSAAPSQPSAPSATSVESVSSILAALSTTPVRAAPPASLCRASADPIGARAGAARACPGAAQRAAG